ncbi:TonB family protein [Paremcibacter congregatus]|uniref:Protein TonB n=1 Tax=Paremcibacter congregatus TaxID=2043170 RepID=A0A2G4YU41_9PROT|nr:TonB family protein [Paremcibacter congregatus]PHZ85864.1 hypothetical protein CRD36_04080 [Paremcibacter congregatus]QDE26828.1 TonB family protein [Paremcibacter congregatus]
MYHFIKILMCIIVMMAPVASVAGDDSDPKAHITQLYKTYITTLKAGDEEKALGLAQEMYSLSPPVFGAYSKSHATMAFNLAQMLEKRREYLAALPYYQEHVDILEKLKAPEDETYLYKLGLLAQAYRNAREEEKAAKWSMKALVLARDLQLPKEVIGDYELELGSSYYGVHGEVRSARRYLKKAHDHYLEVYGEDHVKTAQALFWLAKVDASFRKHRQAAEKLEAVLQVYEKNFPKGHDMTLQVHAFLVGAYEGKGDKDKATEHCIAVATERPTDFDREIDPLYKIAPTYPLSAARSGKEGFVIAEFVVTASGQVENIKTLEGENIRDFEKAAHEALSKFRYAPSIQNGQRVRTEGVLHRVTFKMAQ